MSALTEHPVAREDRERREHPVRRVRPHFKETEFSAELDLHVTFQRPAGEDVSQVRVFVHGVEIPALADAEWVLEACREVE